MTFSDIVTSANHNMDGLAIIHNVAPNGQVASGPRVVVDTLLTQIGTNQIGATFTGSVSGTALTIVSALSGTIRIRHLQYHSGYFKWHL